MFEIKKTTPNFISNATFKTLSQYFVAKSLCFRLYPVHNIRFLQTIK